MRLISQSEAANLKRCERQNIQKLSRKRWGFFYKSPGEADQIDIEHPHWQLYLDGKKPEQEKKAKEQAKKSGKKKIDGGETGEKATPKKAGKKTTGKSAGKKKEAKKAGLKLQGVTGGSGIPNVDIDEALSAYTPISLKELKTYAEVQKLSLEMQVRIGELIERKMVEERMRVLAQTVQMFVDMGRRVSGRICQKLERPGMEKEVEKIINPEQAKIIQDFKVACQKKL